MGKNNFSWIIDDINDSYQFRVFYRDKKDSLITGVFRGKEVRMLDTSELNVIDGNIADINNLFMGMIRFVSDQEEGLYFDVPLRNMNLINEGKEKPSHDIDIKKLQGFAPLDIVSIEVFYMDELCADTKEILELASIYFKMGMQEQFNAAYQINELNRDRMNKKRGNKR